MMYVILKIVQRVYFREDAFGYLFVVGKNLFESVSAELHSGLQVQELSEREAAKVVTFHNVAQLEVFLFQPHDGRSGEDYLQVRETVVAHTKFLAPFRMLEHLVDQ